MNNEIILEVRHVKKYYQKKKKYISELPQYLHAVDDVSFQIRRGETFGLVGESGCGKSTLSRCIMGMMDLTGGEILFEGKKINDLHGKERRLIQRQMQMVFQNPYDSLDPRMTVSETIEEPLIVQKQGNASERRERVQELLELVGLGRASEGKYPHEFSGGQRQRIGIARALALSPNLIICDEPVSALDVSVQAQILNLLRDMQQELGLSYLFISHNLSVVQYMSREIGVMNAGQIVEMASAERLMEHPMHPYTQALISAIPEPDPSRRHERIALNEAPLAPPNDGCPFEPRCWCSKGVVCRERPAMLRYCEEGHIAACHRCRPALPWEGGDAK